MAASRAIVESLAADSAPHYGISTGFGALASKQIPVERRAQLQRSLVRSHAAGSGPEVEREVIRALMLLRLSTLATGRTGVRPVVAETYAAVLNAGITPVVIRIRQPRLLGRPRAARALRARAARRGPGSGCGRHTRRRRGRSRRGWHRTDRAAGEGGSLAHQRHRRDARDAHPRDHRPARTRHHGRPCRRDERRGTARNGCGLRRRPPGSFARRLGRAISAANMRAVLAGSPMLSHPEGFTRVQDAYSLRCAPQVHGGVRDTIEHAATIAGRELASAVDNPVITLDGRVESNGNFHGAPVGYVLDFLAIVSADLASMSERRTDRFLDVSRNHGLNAFLADDPGVDSGHMIAQYTQAGIVSELKRLANPASVDSIPSSAMQEDHVSMGWSAARKLRRSIDGAQRVVAIELLTSARAMDMRAPIEASPVSKAVVAKLRETVPAPGTDRYLAPEIAAAVAGVQDGSLLAAAASVVSQSGGVLV